MQAAIILFFAIHECPYNRYNKCRKKNKDQEQPSIHRVTKISVISIGVITKMEKVTVHPKNHVTEHVHQFGYGKKMNISNYEEGVIGNQRLKTDENEEETKRYFLERSPVGR